VGEDVVGVALGLLVGGGVGTCVGGDVAAVDVDVVVAVVEVVVVVLCIMELWCQKGLDLFYAMQSPQKEVSSLDLPEL
jgi:hypothetical protein